MMLNFFIQDNLIKFDDAPPGNLSDYFWLASFPMLASAIFSLLVWRLWNGKKWYVLSLYYLSIFVILLIVGFVLYFSGIILYFNSINGDIAFEIGVWLVILYGIFSAPAQLVNIIIIGIVGKFILKKFH